MKDKEANRFAIEKAQIKALIDKHRPCTPKTPDEVSRSGTGKNAKVDGRRHFPYTQIMQHTNYIYNRF